MPRGIIDLILAWGNGDTQRYNELKTLILREGWTETVGATKPIGHIGPILVSGLVGGAKR